jgi:hypothetical protein
MIGKEEYVYFVFSDIIPYATAVDAVVVAEASVEVPGGYVKGCCGTLVTVSGLATLAARAASA